MFFVLAAASSTRENLKGKRAINPTLIKGNLNNQSTMEDNDGKSTGGVYYKKW